MHLQRIINIKGLGSYRLIFLLVHRLCHLLVGSDLTRSVPILQPMHDIVSPKFFPPLFDRQEERKRECGKFVLICSTQLPLFLLPNPTPPWFSVLLGHPEGSDHSGVVQHCLEQYSSTTLQVFCCIERWVVISRELPSLGEDLGDWASVSGSHRFVHMVTQSHRGSHSECYSVVQIH